MCGIAGYLDLGGAPPDNAVVQEMTRLLAHRGPDGSGCEVLSAGPDRPTVIFGHARLSVIDLSPAGAQPMKNEDGGVTVVYNGEIYNFVELRRELESQGHKFASQSDTEVIVHAYEQFGTGFVDRLEGMFAFALWDSTKNRLLLARDRAGKKPLYYAWDGRRLTFGSEMKAVLACPWVEAAVAWENVSDLLRFGYVPWPGTMYSEIVQVAPASTVVLEKGRLTESPYWDLGFGETHDTPRQGWGEAGDQVRSLLRTAVKRRLVSDVPLGVLLSGGIDSAAVVAFMSDLGVPIKTFTAGLEDEPSYDERRFARAVAERFGTEHTELSVRVDATDLLDRVIFHFDQPMADSSALPTYLIAKAAREHVTVVLTGDGGDEVFGGYERFAAALLADQTPALLQRAVGAAGRVLPANGGYHNTRRRLERFAGNPGKPIQHRYANWVSIFGSEDLGGILSPDLANQPRSEPAGSFDAAFGRLADAPLLHRLLYANFKTYLHDDLLVKTDRMTMAHGLEARCPFLDIELLEVVAALPPEMKASPFAVKRLLKSSLKGLVPDEILRRRKHGFGVPVGKWFRQSLEAPFRDLVLDSQARSGGAINSKSAGALLEEHLEGRRDNGPRLWSLLCLETWLRSRERPN